MTTPRPWIPIHIADYLADTTHLRAQESGGYLHLIFYYWQNGSVPKNDRKLAAIAKMTAREWKTYGPTIMEFFRADGTHKRIDAELAKVDDISRKRSASAKQMHSKRIAEAHTLHTSHKERKKAPTSSAKSVEDVELYERGKTILGGNSGGLIKQLIDAKDGNIPLARSALETASTKSNPREYIGGVIRLAKKDQDSFYDPRAGIL